MLNLKQIKDYILELSGSFLKITNNLSELTDVGAAKTKLGLNNVNNTADANKSVASAAKLTTARKINGIDFDGTAPITIVDATKEPAFTKKQAFNKNFGSASGTVCQGNDSRLSDARPPTAHTHPYEPEFTTLGVNKGGTGKATLGSGKYILGNGTGAVNEKTSAEVKSDLGIAAVTDAAVAAKAAKVGAGKSGQIFVADAAGDLVASGKSFDNNNATANDVWDAAKITAAIAAGISGVAVTGFQVIKPGPTTPSAANAITVIADVFAPGKLPHPAVKPIVAVNGLMIPEDTNETVGALDSNRWERDGNDLKIKVGYPLNDDDEIVITYSY